MIAASPVVDLVRPLVLLLPVRLERPLPWSRLAADPVVRQAARQGARSCGADYWRVEVYHRGTIYWRNEPTYSCAISLVYVIEDTSRVRERWWHSLRRVPLLWRQG